MHSLDDGQLWHLILFIVALLLSTQTHAHLLPQALAQKQINVCFSADSDSNDSTATPAACEEALTAA